MKKLYIFSILSVKGEAPHSKLAHPNKDCTFMPFGGDEIYTIDGCIWKMLKRKPTISFFPTKSEYALVFDKASKSNMTVLLGLTVKDKLEVPGRGLVILEPFDNSLNDDFIDVGYDVVDFFGLSAVTNVGYSADKFHDILNLDIEVSKYGLINNQEGAMKFTEFANISIEEHAPFLPLKIKKLKVL